ncbi:hypothetical protein FNO01nite_28030 [Flavobacterium noncentrifugens]|uniref:PPIC-type PPIASE domain-containing protein n=1 Tax=Flavobacterium noncentrifugens TaxID=1128970 RepID=A0A1G9CRR2_9FLAO|nr:hypothetical protein [Flavobacterium noncentrifugens]GEP52131.1 hypothetical protein FNO01nite_28030 [Flavobacterium noncentrifugens]SDK54383.1 hypothetical protein SAMN04487935_3630 [Flavobacterium noncentrifugens]
MYRLLYTAMFLSLYSCNFLTPAAKPHSIARVNDAFLYEEDIKDLVPKGTAKPDSIAMVRNFIDHWASQKLLISAAEVNLGKEQKAGFDDLIKQYKIDLYTKAYLEELVNRSVDTIVSEEELKKYYDENKENFRTNGALVRLRYINLEKDNPKLETIKSKFFDYKKSDKKFWDTYALQFKSFAFNDSVWADMSQVYSKLPFINPGNRDEYIVSGKSIQYPEGTAMYLVKIKNVIDRNQIGPYEYLKPTLKEVILNKRKLESIKKFEKEITDDAIKDRKYEIYK